MIKKLAFLLLLAPFALTLSATPTEEVSAPSAQELYIQGIKLEAINTKHATNLIRKAAELSYGPALVRLGLDCWRVSGYFQDKQAITYFAQAAELNNTAGINNLALAYECARGVDRDSQRASELFDKAISLGSKRAQYFKNIISWINKNPWEGSYLRSSYKHSSYSYLLDDGQERPLEFLTREGDIWARIAKTKKDKRSAFKYILGAVALGEPCARILLADTYIKGKIVSRNRSEGIKLLNEEIASAYPHPEAFLILAWCYQTKSGVKKNLQKAFELYQQHAELTGNHTEVIWSLYLGIGTPVDYKKCVEYCSQFKTHLNEQLLHLYARLLYFGDGTEQNTQLAQELLEVSLRGYVRYDNCPSKHIDFAATGSNKGNNLKDFYSLEKYLRKNGPKHKDKRLKKEWAQLLRGMPQKYDQFVQERNAAADNSYRILSNSITPAE